MFLYSTFVLLFQSFLYSFLESPMMLRSVMFQWDLYSRSKFLEEPNEVRRSISATFLFNNIIRLRDSILILCCHLSIFLECFFSIAEDVEICYVSCSFFLFGFFGILFFWGRWGFWDLAFASCSSSFLDLSRIFLRVLEICPCILVHLFCCIQLEATKPVTRPVPSWTRGIRPHCDDALTGSSSTCALYVSNLF